MWGLVGRVRKEDGVCDPTSSLVIYFWAIISPRCSSPSTRCSGWLAQVVECLLWVQDVGGSSPSSPFPSFCNFFDRSYQVLSHILDKITLKSTDIAL